MLSIENQINYLKRNKGIKFIDMTETEAKKKLKEVSYYYKITCFRKNFRKNNQDRYRNLDFAVLYDMSVIDARLRQLILKLTLDLEHELKTDLLSAISEDPNEDGFNIVNEFDSYERRKFYSKPNNSNKRYTNIQAMIMGKYLDTDLHSYDRDLVNTYHIPGRIGRQGSNKILPIYTLMERMSYGKLNNFIGFYFSANKHNANYFTNAASLLIMTKRLRDASAHNRPVLLNIVRTSGAHGIVNILSTEVTGYLQLIGLLNAKNRFILKNVRMHDLFCLIMLHHEYIKNPIVKSLRKRELVRLLNRAQNSKNLYKNHSTIREIYKFFGAVAQSL